MGVGQPPFPEPLAAGVDDNEQDAEAEPSAPPCGSVDELAAPTTTRDFVRDLWPFAFSKASCLQIIKAFPANPEIHHVVIISRSAHPSWLLAAHGLGKYGHMLAEGQSEHSVAHGKKILRDNLYAEYLAAAKAAIDPAKKRVLTDCPPGPSVAWGTLAKNLGFCPPHDHGSLHAELYFLIGAQPQSACCSAG